MATHHLYSPYVSNHRGLGLALAILGVYFVWDTSFHATRFTIKTLPPVLMNSTCYLFAGILLYTMVRFARIARPSRRDWKKSAFLWIHVPDIRDSTAAPVADLLGFRSKSIVIEDRT